MIPSGIKFTVQDLDQGQPRVEAGQPLVDWIQDVGKAFTRRRCCFRRVCRATSFGRRRLAFGWRTCTLVFLHDYNVEAPVDVFLKSFQISSLSSLLIQFFRQVSSVWRHLQHFRFGKGFLSFCGRLLLRSSLFILDKNCVYLNAERLSHHINRGTFQTCTSTSPQLQALVKRSRKQKRWRRSFSRTTVNCSQMRCC